MAGELTHFSLFTGVAGIDLSAEWAGFRTVGQCEWADYPTQVLEQHHPGVPRWRDIRSVTKESFQERTGLHTVDLVSGGFPCQPFSAAGSRRGVDDDRYLWPEMLRVIEELRPTWVIGENVDGITSMVLEHSPVKVESRSVTRNQDYDFYEAVYSRQEIMLLDSVCQDLEKRGYEVQPFVIPACGVGAPHQRYRVFIVAHSAKSKQQGDKARILCEQERATAKVGREDLRQENREASADQFRPIVQDVAHSNDNKAARQRKHSGEVLPIAESKRPNMGSADVAHSAGLQCSPGAEKQGTLREVPADGREHDYLNRPGETQSDVANSQEQSERSGLCPNEKTEQRRGRLGDSGSAGSERPTQPRLGGNFDGAADRIHGYQWPAGPGEAQYEWEPPRIAEGIENRRQRLECLGNMVVPYQPLPILAAIAAIERSA